jgi:hypothetical protein
MTTILLAVALAAGAIEQDNAAADAQRRLQLKPAQLVALYLEAAYVHDGLIYTVDFARFDDCSEAQRLIAQLDTPPNHVKALRQIVKTTRYANRYLFAMEPELREQVRSMREGERTGVKLANGECLVVELVESKAQGMLEAKELGPVLPLMVYRGWLPHPDQLEQDPKLRNRTIANKIHSVADVDAAPAGFDFNTIRSDGQPILNAALMLNKPDMARAVLERGANPNLCGPRYCPIQLALTMRDRQEAGAMLDRLLQAGGDPNQFDRGQRTRLLPLASAASKDLALVERLVKAGAKPNGLPDASPPIFFAAATGRQDIVDYLVAQGADLFARDTSRRGLPNTVYTAAAETKSPLFIEWIEKRMMEAAAKSGKYKCEVWLEQDGRRINPSSGEYRLKRAPFRIVVRLAEPSAGGVLVASAQTPAFHDDMRGRAPESAVFRTTTAAAEEGDGTSDWLDVLPSGVPTSNGTTQFWFWTSEADRRFTGKRGPERAIEYYKDIRTIALDDGAKGEQFKPMPIAQYSGSDIYIVAAVPVVLSVFDQRFIEPTLMKITFTDSTRRASR